MRTCESIDVRVHRLAEALEAKMIGWRRDFHAHPELANQEVRTSGIVAAHLRRLGFDEVRTGLGGGTGVVGILRGGKPGPVVGLRADMDALPIEEATGLAFASTARADWGGRNVPVMHACGHDVHTAIVMAAGEVFAQLREEIAGTIMLIFQPAEEGPAKSWQGLSGAALMLREGVFDDPTPSALFALHVGLTGGRGTAGRITYHSGDGSYAMSVFRLTITGRGGHAALPWDCVDPIVIAGQTITALQTVPSRSVNVNTNHVTLSLGMIQGGEKFNVIPETVVIEGALRFTDGGTRAALERRVEEIATGTARAGGGSARVDWYLRCPILHNDAALVALLHPSFAKATGDAGRVARNGGFGLDDFACFSERVPSLFFVLDVAPDPAEPREVGTYHTPTFWVNEAAMITGLKAMVHLCLDYLATHDAETLAAARQKFAATAGAGGGVVEVAQSDAGG